MTAAKIDQKYMRRALKLAALGRFSTSPNPKVGAVLVAGRQIIGTGYHQQAGCPHAEINALNAAKAAGFAVAGAVMYVTLEPCAHQGRTGACADALVAAKVAKVVIATLDPNPKVAGKGVARLQQAGIAVVVGVLADKARFLNRGFICQMARATPWVILKTASSLDAKTAMANGESQWITGSQARQDVHRWRLACDAVITGSGTIRADNPSLNARYVPAAHFASRDGVPICAQPLRVVLAHDLNIDPRSHIFQNQGSVLLICSNRVLKTQAEQFCHQVRQCAQNTANVEVVCQPNAQIDLTQVLQLLAARQCQCVLVEAGATLATGFWQAGLVDEWLYYLAPKIMGKSARTVLTADFARLADCHNMRLKKPQKKGADVLLRFLLRDKNYLATLCAAATED